MSVEIDPQELGFQRPLTVEVSQILKIKNPNHLPVAFKVKTTAPKQYCVRPNSGRIEPGKEVEVSVLLQAMKQDPPADAKCRDKFLVQSVALTADKEFSNIGNIWQHVDNAEKDSVHEKKIRVVFLAAEKSSAAAVTSTPIKNGLSNGTSEGHSFDDDPSSPPQYTPQQHATGPVSTFDEKPRDAKSSADARNSANNPAVTAPTSVRESVSSAAAAVVDAVPQSTEELKEQLAQAQATIASYAQEGGLRLRKAAGVATSSESSGTTDMSVAQQNSTGVPVQIVAALCLVSFLLAYLLF